MNIPFKVPGAETMTNSNRPYECFKLKLTMINCDLFRTNAIEQEKTSQRAMKLKTIQYLEEIVLLEEVLDGSVNENIRST